jgi:gliding motility-associated lipoprotein GldH
MDKKGNWNGDKSGILVNFNYSLYKNIKFPLKGDYKFKLIQAMRDTILKDVMSVGIKITQPIKKL